MAIPAPIITQPTSEPFFSTNLSIVALGGTFAASVGITSILVNGSSGGVVLSGSISGDFWSFDTPPLQNGDNIFSVVATDGTNFSQPDTVTIIFNSGLNTAIAVTPSGISLIQGRNVVTLNVPFPSDTTNFQGFNFYGRKILEVGR